MINVTRYLFIYFSNLVFPFWGQLAPRPLRSISTEKITHD